MTILSQTIIVPTLLISDIRACVQHQLRGLYDGSIALSWPGLHPVSELGYYMLENDAPIFKERIMLSVEHVLFDKYRIDREDKDSVVCAVACGYLRQDYPKFSKNFTGQGIPVSIRFRVPINSDERPLRGYLRSL